MTGTAPMSLWGPFRCDHVRVQRAMWLSLAIALLVALALEVVCRVLLGLGEGWTPLVVIPGALAARYFSRAVLTRSHRE